MKTEVIARFETSTGLLAFEVKGTTLPNGKTTYRYDGKHGAGCGDLSDIKRTIAVTCQSRRGIKQVATTTAYNEA